MNYRKLYNLGDQFSDYFPELQDRFQEYLIRLTKDECRHFIIGVNKNYIVEYVKKYPQNTYEIEQLILPPSGHISGSNRFYELFVHRLEDAPYEVLTGIMHNIQCGVYHLSYDQLVLVCSILNNNYENCGTNYFEQTFNRQNEREYAKAQELLNNLRLVKKHFPEEYYELSTI